MTEAERIFFK